MAGRILELRLRGCRDIRKLAGFLYLLRSRFVHEAELVLELGAATSHVVGRKGLVRSDLSLDAVFDAF